MLDAYNKRYEIVSKFQPEIQAIDEKYSNEYKQSYDKDLKDFMNGNFDVYKKWDIGALEEISSLPSFTNKKAILCLASFLVD